MKNNFVFLLLLSTQTLLFGQSVFRIGTVIDGSQAELNAQHDMFISEINKVSEGEFLLHFPKNKQLDGNFSVQTTDKQIERLENDPSVDMVLLIGGISSQLALKKNILHKPTFAPFVYNVSLSGVSHTENFSNIRNLNYLTDELTLNEEIQTFSHIVPFKHLAILVDESQYRLFSTTAERLIIEAQQKEITLQFIQVSGSNENISAKIPADVQAVMLAPLPNLDSKAAKSLYEELIKRKLPTYALSEGDRVKDGVLVSQIASSNRVRRARSTALNMLAVMRGEQTQKQPIEFKEKRSVYINMATARAIGIYPKYSVLANAVLLNEIKEKKPNLTFASIAQEAVHANLSLITSRLGVESDKENIAEVRSVLFPHVSAELGYTQLNSDNAYVKDGFYAEKSTDGALKVQQVIFSEKALANLEIQKKLHVAVEQKQRALELEVVKQASTLFLNMLVAQTQYKIQTDNLALTTSNLELAKGRVEAGTTDMSDVYYWQSTIASVKQNVLHVKAEVEKAKDALNHILNRNIADRFIMDIPSLNDPSIRKNLDLVTEMLNDQQSYNAIEKFLLQEGMANSCELHQLDAQLSAQKRQLLSNERAYYVPDIIAAAEVSHVFNETRNPIAGISLENTTDWQAGVKVSLPLYEGGAKDAKTSRTRLNLQQTQVVYIDTKQSIEQQIRGDLHSIEASYPSIALAKQATNAAHKSFEIVRENYAQGTRSVSDLLTAQNNALVAEQAATNASYRFLIDALQLQRDISNFTLLLQPSDEDFLHRMKQFVHDYNSKKTVHTNNQQEEEK
ncbi:MAG: ABC transporter substrate binding protein [Thiovulaceae bacterium]|nr:ABC transporter substrate binding protein [Sulfurimonadaceae bacterium]